VETLLEQALEAHGGRDRWSKLSALTAHLAVGGPFWAVRGFPDAFLDETLTIDVAARRAVLSPWIFQASAPTSPTIRSPRSRTPRPGPSTPESTPVSRTSWYAANHRPIPTYR
jgi:hypothetical protein